MLYRGPQGTGAQMLLVTQRATDGSLEASASVEERETDIEI